MTWLRRCVVAIPFLCGCSNGTGPGTAGPLFLSATLDGRVWQADTTFTFLNGTIAGLSATRFPQPGTPAQEPLVIALGHFTGAGTYALSDALTDNQADFIVRDALGQTPFIYATRSSHPGTLTITSYTPAESTIAGSFSIPLYAQTDTTRVHLFVGQFRLRDDL